MGTVIYSMNPSLDGFITDLDGGLEWSVPDAEFFRAALEEVRGLDAHLLGHRLYDAMVYWDDPANGADWTDDEREFAEIWRALPKIVFSTTLTEVHGANTRLATESLESELGRLRADSAVGEVAIGGAALAAAAAAADLIDEYRIRVHPVLLGGGTPFFPDAGRRVPLELVSSRALSGGVVASRYRVVREQGQNA